MNVYQTYATSVKVYYIKLFQTQLRSFLSTQFQLETYTEG